jgi:two-component system OmpR family sensor kinase
MTIRLRFTIAFAAGILATLLAAGVVVWWQMGQSLRASLDTALQTRSSGVLASFENNGQFGLQETDRSAPGVFAAIFSPSGQVLDASSDTPSGLRPTAGVQSVGGRQYLVRTDAAADGSIVVTGVDLQSVTDAQAALERALLGVGLVAGSIALAGSWFLGGRALQPLHRLSEEAAALEPADLGRRLRMTGGHDEVWRLTATLNAMLDRIADSVERQRRFVAMASHELRTPLASLRAELDVVDGNDSNLAEYRQAVHEAQGDIVRLTELTTSLLELASPEVDESSVARASVDLRQLVTGVVRSLQPLARERGVRVRIEAPADSVLVDRTRIEHGLNNLITNAIVHGGQGEVLVRCGIIERGAGRSLRAEVLDRGPGIGSYSPHELFQPFRRGSSVTEPGTGLGLAIVAGAAQAHGGTYGAASRDGGGAVFWFEIPDVGD